jgi:hypothetical protein
MTENEDRTHVLLVLHEELAVWAKGMRKLRTSGEVWAALMLVTDITMEKLHGISRGMGKGEIDPMVDSTVHDNSWSASA